MPARFYDIEKIKNFKAEINYVSILKEYGKKTTDQLKRNPGNFDKHRKNKEYSSTWRNKTEKIGTVTETVVYNKSNGSLTHLLENGHLIVNKHGSVGWAAPHPHISKVFDDIKDDFVRAIETKTQINIDIT